MRNRNRNKRNQPPTGQGKRQSPRAGAPRKLSKRSLVAQAQRWHPELNIGDSSEEEARRSTGLLATPNPRRPKAGR